MAANIIPAAGWASKRSTDCGCGAFRSTLFGNGFLRCLLDVGRRLSRESETCCQSPGITGGGR